MFATCSSILALALFVGGQQPVQTIPWPKPGYFKIVNGRLDVSSLGESTVVLSWEKPKLPSNRFVLKTRATGHARSYAVLEASLIRKTKEGDETTLVVRTNDTGGPMAKLCGDFKDHVVELPFATDPAAPPDLIEVKVHFYDWFEAKGWITLEPFTVEPWLPFSLTWFAAGGFAMLIGVGVGLLGGLYALLAAIPTFRRTAYFAGKLLVWLGLLAMIAAAGLFYSSVPSGIWIPVGVAGLLSVAGFGLTLPLVRKGLTDDEQRRTAANDFLEPA